MLCSQAAILYSKYQFLSQAPQAQNMLRLFSLRVVLFISLHVRAVELVILVKPIGISTHVLMSISFGTKIPTFLNILVLLKVVLG